MTTAYTSLLGLALPVTGELSGTWGDTVNNYITSYVDSAVEGTQTISGSQTSVTLSVTNGSSLSQAGTGTTGSAQFSIINCTGSPASLLTVTVPASSRQYIVINGTSTSQSVKIVGAGPTTGVTLVSGEKAHVAWNGSDFVKVASTVITNLTGTLAIANGGTGQTTASAAFNALSPITSTGDLILGNGVNSATRLAIGTNGYVLTSNGTTWQSTAPASPIGVGQTWQLPSRSLSTTYTNSTGKPIQVHVVMQASGGGGGSTTTAVVDGVTISSGSTNNVSGGAGCVTHSFIVPNGSTYSITAGGMSSLTVSTWAELR